MVKIKRLDFLQVPFPKAHRTDQGFLKAPIRATRVGIFKYIQPDGSIRRELRPPEEVFNADSMASLANVPITDRHPKQLVSSKNAKSLTVGFTGDKVVKEEETYVTVQGSIIDEAKINRIDALKNQEVSCGYVADLEEAPGVYQGESYDVIQRNIRYNHLALVDKGRAGANVRVILDSDEAVLYNDNITIGDSMKIKIGDKEYEVSDEAGKAFNAEMKKKDEFSAKSKEKAEKEKKDSEDEVAKVKSELDKANAKADAKDAEVKGLKEENEELKKKNDSIDLEALVAERKDIESKAGKFLGEEKLDGLSNDEIKKKVVSKVLSDVKVDEKSSEYINTSFETITKMEVKVDAIADAFNQKEDEEHNDEEESFAPDELAEKTENAYKTKF